MTVRTWLGILLLASVACLIFAWVVKREDGKNQKNERLDALAKIALNEREDIKQRIKALQELIRCNDPRGNIWPQFAYRKGVSSSDVIEILCLLKNYRYQETKDDLLDLVTDWRLILGIRIRAAQVLAAWGDKRVLTPIMEMFKYADSWFREMLIDALGDLKEPSTEGFLLSIMNDPAYSGGERMAAAEALVKLGNKKAIDFVFSVYDESGGEAEVYPFDRLTRIIANIGGDRAINALSEQIDRLPHEVIQVISAMRKIGSPKCIPPLLKIAEDDYEHETYVRIAAAEALLEQFVNHMSLAQRQRLRLAIQGIIQYIESYDNICKEEGENLKKLAREKGLEID